MPTRFVVGNSVVMSWCFADEENSYAEAVLESLEFGEAFVPAIWPLEVGNVLLVAERKKRLSQASVVRFLALLGGLPITVEQETPERMLKEIVSLAREPPRIVKSRPTNHTGFQPMTLPIWTSP